MSESLNARGEAAVQVELERYYGGAKALLAQNEAFLKGITEALLLTLHHTRRGEQARRVWTDFNPRPPRGGRQRPSTTAMRPLEFQSTPPRGGRPAWWTATSCGASNFNPRPPRGGRRELRHWEGIGQSISIHAPREGGRLHAPKHDLRTGWISIHAPREGGRLRQRLCGAGGGGAEVAGSI